MACNSFSMRTDSFFLEYEGKFWVLHVFDVDGEEDVFGITLNLLAAEGYLGFQNTFHQCLDLVRADHPDAALCESCRPRVGLEWMSRFSDWVKAAYAAMPVPPSPVPEVPEVVRLSFESMVSSGSEEDPSSLS